MLKTISSYALLLRPHQWLKNLLLLFPPFFGGRLFAPEVIAIAAPAIASFCAASSCSYIVNDIVDLQADRGHITKKYRVLARGEVKVPVAMVLAGLLYLVSILTAAQVSERFQGCLIIYLFISVFYSLFLKQHVVVDICALSAGYIVRVLAGGEAFRIPVSPWLFLTVFVVAIFLSSGKRLGEIIKLGSDAGDHRRSLRHYTPRFLENVQIVSAAIAMATFTLYTIENNRRMFYTFPISIYGFIRYLSVVKRGNGDPTEVLLKDPQMFVIGAVWAIVVAFAI